jgi:hypothetical protein
VDGPNLLLDDTLAGEVDKGLLGAVRDSIVQVRLMCACVRLMCACVRMCVCVGGWGRPLGL